MLPQQACLVLDTGRMRVASRRIRSNSWHARETVSGPEDAADGLFQQAASGVTPPIRINLPLTEGP